MKFPLDRLQVLDMSVYDDDKIIQPCYDVIMSFFDKGEAESVMKQIITNHKKAELFDCIIPFLQKELTPKQMKLLKIVADPQSRKILTYLASEQKNK